MDHRPFGRTGLTFPCLGFGAGHVGDPALAEAEVGRLLHGVLDLGVTLIDTARSYGLSEERIGRHLAGRRNEFVLSTHPCRLPRPWGRMGRADLKSWALST
jgi:aryl-alcohol dehydrogenase-like predicted oxidoreductase